MNKRLFITLLILTSLNSFSQEIQKGNIIKDRQFLIDKKETTLIDNIGNIVSIRPHRVNGTLRNYYVEFFDDLSFNERIEIKTQNSTDILELFILDEKVHVLIKEKEKKNISLRFDIIDLKTRNKTEHLLLKADKSSQPNIYKSLKDDYNISIDYTSKIVLSIPVIEDKTTYVFVKTFNKNSIVESEHRIYPNKNLNHRDISFLNMLQNNNNTYILLSMSEQDGNKYYQLIELNQDLQRQLKIPIEKDNYELINAKISDINFILSGLYSKQKKGAFEGFTHYSINLDTFEVDSRKRSSFLTKEAKDYFIGLFKSNRSIDIKSIFTDKSDNTYIVGQLYTIRKQSVPIGIPIASIAIGSASAFVTYYPISVSYKVYDDILIGKIDSKSELIWDNILEMRQTEKIKSKSNKRDSSSYTFFSNDQVNILMNGYINMEKDKLIVKQDKRKTKTNFYNITVNPNGGISPKIIFSNLDSEILFRAENSVENNAVVYILGQGNMRKQLLKLTF